MVNLCFFKDLDLILVFLKDYNSLFFEFMPNLNIIHQWDL